MKFVYLKYIKNEMLNIKPMLTISFFFDFVSLKQFIILAIKKLKIIENIINIKCFMSFMEQKNILHAASHNFDKLNSFCLEKSKMLKILVKIKIYTLLNQKTLSLRKIILQCYQNNLIF